jgi:hypothetical protein
MRPEKPAGPKALPAIGLWSDSPRGGVDPRLLVDPAWAGNDRARLVEYLSNGVEWCAYLGFSFCRFQCGIPNDQMGSTTLTDGSWLWPEGLPHYVASHGIALPDAFLDHARARDFTIATSKPNGPPSQMLEENVQVWEEWAATRGALHIHDLSRARVAAFMVRVSSAGHCVLNDGDEFVLPQEDGEVRISYIRWRWQVRRKTGRISWPFGGASTEAELEEFLASAIGRPIF